MEKIEIFDLDGTLTKYFSKETGDKTNTGLDTYSTWNLITQDLVVDKKDFAKKAAAWKQMITTADDIDKIQSSKEMTEIGINLFRQEFTNADAVWTKAAEITEFFCKNGIIIFDAIKYLEYRLSQNTTCVISTASYEDGARGFVEGLVACNLLDKRLAEKIIFSGTRIDWETLQVVHMNVDGNKLIGLEASLGSGLSEIQPQINAVFGDDPKINDRALLDGLCKHSFVIRTDKNVNFDLPQCCVLTDWPEIYSNRDQLGLLHQELSKV